MVRNKAPIKTKIVAECPHCGDKSFEVKITGQFCIGHVESGNTVLTDTPTKVEQEDGMLLQIITVKTAKG